MQTTSVTRIMMCCVDWWAVVGMDVRVCVYGGASAVSAVLHGRDLCT